MDAPRKGTRKPTGRLAAVDAQIWVISSRRTKSWVMEFDAEARRRRGSADSLRPRDSACSFVGGTTKVRIRKGRGESAATLGIASSDPAGSTAPRTVPSAMPSVSDGASKSRSPRQRRGERDEEDRWIPWSLRSTFAGLDWSERSQQQSSGMEPPVALHAPCRFGGYGRRADRGNLWADVTQGDVSARKTRVDLPPGLRCLCPFGTSDACPVAWGGEESRELIRMDGKDAAAIGTAGSGPDTGTTAPRYDVLGNEVGVTDPLSKHTKPHGQGREPTGTAGESVADLGSKLPRHLLAHCLFPMPGFTCGPGSRFYHSGRITRVEVGTAERIQL